MFAWPSWRKIDKNPYDVSHTVYIMDTAPRKVISSKCSKYKCTKIRYKRAKIFRHVGIKVLGKGTAKSVHLYTKFETYVSTTNPDQQETGAGR